MQLILEDGEVNVEGSKAMRKECEGLIRAPGVKWSKVADVTCARRGELLSS